MLDTVELKSSGSGGSRSGCRGSLRPHSGLALTVLIGLAVVLLHLAEPTNAKVTKKCDMIPPFSYGICFIKLTHRKERLCRGKRAEADIKRAPLYDEPVPNGAMQWNLSLEGSKLRKPKLVLGNLLLTEERAKSMRKRSFLPPGLTCECCVHRCTDAEIAQHCY